MKRHVLFVPGFRENLSSRNYKAILHTIESKSYDVTFVSIDWQKTLLPDWVNELNAVYKNYNPSQTILAGFSFGSLTALLAASQRIPSDLWLFSLSPYFADDMPNMDQSSLRNIGKKRTTYFKTLDFNEIAKKIKCPTNIYYGEIEAKKYPLIGRRAKIAHQKIKQSRLFKVEETGHDVTAPNYVKTIEDSLEKHHI